MRFDTWSKTKKQELDQTYHHLFGGQVRVMKTLYKNKKDPILLDELLMNVSINIFQTMQLNQFEQAEALIERMFLSILEYDIVLLKDSILDEYSAYLYFFNDYHTIEYNEIRIRDAQDLKRLLEMIMYVGASYDYLLRHDNDVEQHLDDYHLLEGFDLDFTEYTNNLIEMEKFIS